MSRRLRFTESHDGRARTTLRVEFRVGLNDLGMAAASILYNAGVDGVAPPRLTRKLVLEALHDGLASDGRAWEPDTELSSEDGVIDCWHPGYEAAARLFPEAPR